MPTPHSDTAAVTTKRRRVDGPPAAWMGEGGHQEPEPIRWLMGASQIAVPVNGETSPMLHRVLRRGGESGDDHAKALYEELVDGNHGDTEQWVAFFDERDTKALSAAANRFWRLHPPGERREVERFAQQLRDHNA